MGLPAEITGYVPESGVAIWWLGQSGFVIRGRSATIAIDPFLTDYGHFGRVYEPPCAPAELDFLDLLLGTHDHADHIDPLGFPQLMNASPAAVAIVPAPVVPRVAGLVGSAHRLLGASTGKSIERGSVTITPIPAVHAVEPADGYGFHLDAAGEHPFLGYLIELDGVRLCHTGDTLVYEGLAERLREADLDVLMLPINGVSWFRERRGLVGNMNAFEAAELADLSGVRMVIPMHWDLFADNTANPQHLVDYAAANHPAVNVAVPSLGVRTDVMKGAVHRPGES
jgi:L-ascorbate 6-phosphate lactonase